MSEKRISIPLIVGGLMLIIVFGTGGIALFLSNRSNSNTTQNTANTTSFENVSSVSNLVSSPVVSNNGQILLNSDASNYKDGTYTAVGSYYSPDGIEDISVTVDLKDGVVESVKVTPQSSGESYIYQQRFSAGISSAVVGKKINQAHVGRINGASLTATGFNNAIDSIIDRALP